MRLLIVDNHDSFTYNLYQMAAALDGVEATVVPNDAPGIDAAFLAGFDGVILSPGPGRPDRAGDFGACRFVLENARVPVLGVCLGHQGIGHLHGARLERASEVMHGRASAIHHDGTGLFAGLPPAFEAVRYHSLVLVDPLPAPLCVTARAPDGTIMALEHRARPLWGVQFHPESVGSEAGPALLRNFRDRVAGTGGAAARAGGSPPDPGPPPDTGWRVAWRRLDRWVDPEAAFVALHGDAATAFWLDSSRTEAGGARWSFMGDAGGPHAAVVAYDSPRRRLTVRRADGTETRDAALFPWLAARLAACRAAASDLPFDFPGGFVGYFGYELKGEPGAAGPHRAATPDAAFLFADRFLAFDHQAGAVYPVALHPAGDGADAAAWLDGTAAALARVTPPAPPAPRSLGPVRPRHDRAAYLDRIERCFDAITAGESYEICLTNQLTAAAPGDALALYRLLRRHNPAAHAAFLRFPECAVLSSSPERFLRVGADGTAEARPIKGTAPRGATPAEDERLAGALRADPKTRAENLMIADLLRNDLGRVCRVGSVHVPALMAVEPWATVHQMVTTVRGRLRPECTALDAVRAAFPPGSMTGAPKERTLALLDGLEDGPRGVYSGALGWLGVNGAADLSVVIRTLVHTGDTVSVGAGGAIVAQSDPAAEHDEMLTKARAVLGAFP